MPAPSRKQRLESLLHREIATVVNQELRDPRLGFVTITRVELTSDLHQVKAFFTVLGDEKQRRLATRALENAVPYVQRAYAPAVRTRLLPQLAFAYDDHEEKRHGIATLISKARATDPSQDPAPAEGTDLPPGARVDSTPVIGEAAGADAPDEDASAGVTPSEPTP